MSFLILFVLLIVFCIYMYINDGYIYIASRHFEKEISVEKMKNNVVKNTCKGCGITIPDGEKYCETCKKKQLNSYSNSNEFGDIGDSIIRDNMKKRF